MADAKYFVTFIVASTILNIFLVGAYTSFDQTLTTITPAEYLAGNYDWNYDIDELTFYFQTKSAFDTLDEQNWLVLEPLKDLIVFTLDVITLGIFSDYGAALVMIWASLPYELFYILFLPMILGMIYSIVALIRGS